MDHKKNIESISSIIRRGEKPKNQFKIGVELEHFVVDAEDYRSIDFYEEKGIEHILERMLEKDYKGKYEGEYLIGLTREDREITLEPGGQIEVSIKPCATIEEVKNIYFQFLEDIIPILEEQRQLLLAIGYHPKSSIRNIPFNPKVRYQYMSKYLGAKGKYAHNMMKGTAALQVAIDYKNEEDFIQKLRVANFISPLLYLLSDNSPIFEGKIYEGHSLRSIIWDNTDKDRSGIIPEVLTKSFGYKEYAQYILNLPPILMLKDGEWIGTDQKTVGELMQQYDFDDEEIEHLLTMTFPDVRAKKYIEIRMGDALPYPFNFSYVVLIKGIFYNHIALEYLYQWSQRMEEEEVRICKNTMVEKGFKARFGSKNIYDCIRVLFDLAKKALTEEEKELLKPLENLIIHRVNGAMISKEKIRQEGIKALDWCSLNQWIVGGMNDNEYKKTVRSI